MSPKPPCSLGGELRLNLRESGYRACPFHRCALLTPLLLRGTLITGEQRKCGGRGHPELLQHPFLRHSSALDQIPSSHGLEEEARNTRPHFSAIQTAVLRNQHEKHKI